MRFHSLPGIGVLNQKRISSNGQGNDTHVVPFDSLFVLRVSGQDSVIFFVVGDPADRIRQARRLPYVLCHRSTLDGTLACAKPRLPKSCASGRRFGEGRGLVAVS